MTILVCGGYGFIGSAFIRNYLKNNPQEKIINLDNLTIGSNKDNLKEIEKNQNYTFIHDDIRNQETTNKLAKDCVISFITPIPQKLLLKKLEVLVNLSN